MKAVAVEPMEQMLITDAKGGEKIGDQGPHKIQGMGAGKSSFEYLSVIAFASRMY